MLRNHLSVGLCVGLLVCASHGCSHFNESRPIEQFAAALQEGNLDQLRAMTSHNFRAKALRLDESIDDLKILRLPDGKTSVVDVEDVSENEKRVTVQIEESNQKLLYKLTRQDKNEPWVVDDIYVRQKRQGLKVAKSVTEQMDLLLSVREFLAAWQDGDRADVLHSTTPEFQELLSELPPRYLAQLTRQVIGDPSRSSRHRPEAQMDRDVAIVRLSRSSGQMVISLRMIDSTWKVDDVAVEANKNHAHIPSVRKMASVLRSATEFLDAYEQQNKASLAELCTPKFYKESLAPSDLSTIPLVSVEQIWSDYQVKTEAHYADLVIPGKTDTIKINLLLEDNDDDLDAPPTYRVDEVTLYAADGSQQKRLSALFTGRAKMLLFSEALASRDVSMLKTLSTPDFNDRVWKQVDGELMQALPLEAFRTAADQIVKTEFRGAVTEMIVQQGDHQVVYVLKDWNGDIRVDDLQVDMPNRPESVKVTLELMLPIYKFAVGVHRAELSQIQRHSSRDFNRLVWRQARQVPEIGLQVPQHFVEPLHSLRLQGETARVRLGNEHRGVDVLLVREHEQWVLDEAMLIAGADPHQRTRLKQAMRNQMAYGLDIAREENSSVIQHAGSGNRGSSQNAVMHADFTTQAGFTPRADFHDNDVQSHFEQAHFEKQVPFEAEQQALNRTEQKPPRRPSSFKRGQIDRDDREQDDPFPPIDIPLD